MPIKNWKKINTIFTEVPFNKIKYITRPEFTNGQEEFFYKSLKESIKKRGLLDPLFLTNIDGKLKTIVGNNRMVICKKLEIKKIKCIITQIGKEDTFLKGKILKTDKEIKDLFHLPEEVTVRRTKGGWVDQVNATKFITIRNKYEI
tara:strand:- start:164 stop:601 length:438 start_codon:yes stop_codon:yes gene_type:complete